MAHEDTRLAEPRVRGPRSGKSAPAWASERPATTIACDRRVHPPGHKQNACDPPGRYQQRRGANAVRVTVSQAAVLQGFPADYPWQGARTRQFEQVGNAVPPPLAHRVLEQAIEPGDRRTPGYGGAKSGDRRESGGLSPVASVVLSGVAVRGAVCGAVHGPPRDRRACRVPPAWVRVLGVSRCATSL